MVVKVTLNGDDFRKHKHNKKVRILLVEDNEEYNLIIKILLKRLGYEVISTTDGETALTLYNESYDLVITDIVMPKMGGVELIQRLRNRNSEVKCIAITGHTNLEIPEGIPVLYKPFSTTLLLQYVNTILNYQIIPVNSTDMGYT
ncbi:MAG: response regulator [Candidatus Heimdallarchaeota archaeon]|nr:response regulator [Candidatus Heimdallarchaeota archaeon]